MRPSVKINLVSLAFCAIGLFGLFWLDSKEMAAIIIVSLTFTCILQTDITDTLMAGAASITAKLLMRQVELRDELEELDDIVREAMRELQNKNEIAALNTLTAGVYMRERRENG